MHLKFTYNKIPIKNENEFSFKQMKFQRYLPKKGFLNINIEKVSNFKSLLECFDFKNETSLISNRDFYTSIFCLPFSEDEDLSSLFSGYQTPSVYGKLAYGVDFIKNFPITMNSVIMEYFQNKKMRIELRIFFKEANEDDEENNFVVLGTCEIPLVGLLINADGLINDEFCLSNEYLQFSDVFVKLNMSFTEKAAIVKGNSFSKPFGCITINILELIFDEINFEDQRNIVFSLTFKKKILKSGKIQLQKEKSNNGFVFLPDVNFILRVENTQELLLQPLEIQISNEDNEVFGYLNLDLSEIIKNVKHSFFKYNNFKLIRNHAFALMDISFQAIRIA